MSKGNFLDFSQEISSDEAQRKEFFDKLYAPGISKEDLLKFFHGKEYQDVSLDDCAKMLVVAAAGDIREACEFGVKY